MIHHFSFGSDFFHGTFNDSMISFNVGLLDGVLINGDP